jgi:hypothetical protein
MPAGETWWASQELHRLLPEHTLLMIDDQPVLLDPLQRLPQMAVVLLHIVAGDQQVFQIHEAEEKVEEDAIHLVLESHAGVFQAERHANELKQPEQRYHRRFVDVCCRHWQLVVTLLQIMLGENCTAICCCVEVAEIAAGSPAAAFLPHHVQGAGPAAGRPRDDATASNIFLNSVLAAARCTGSKQ